MFVEGKEEGSGDEGQGARIAGHHLPFPISLPPSGTHGFLSHTVEPTVVHTEEARALTLNVR